MSKRLALLVFAVLSVGVAGISGWAASSDPPAAPAFDHANSDLTLPAARAFTEFDLFYVGDTFDGQALHAINRVKGKPYMFGPPSAPNYVSLKYGDCTPGPDSGCPFPLEVQVWPLCDRNPAMYSLTPDPDGNGPKRATPLPSTPLTVRGVPAALYDQDTRLELYTGEEAVVLFGTDRQQLMRAARELEGLTRPLPATVNLPAPPPGIMNKVVNCR